MPSLAAMNRDDAPPSPSLPRGANRPDGRADAKIEGRAVGKREGRADARPGRAPRDETRARSQTTPARRLTRAEIAAGIALADDMDYRRPRTRADCENGIRPCPFVSCRYHLYLDVNPTTGSMKRNFPDLEVWEMPQTCALDVASQGGVTLEEVGEIMNLTRERIRQLEQAGLERLQQESFVSEALRLEGKA